MSIVDLSLALAGLIEGRPSLWQRLTGAHDERPQGSGHPVAKSRPPATLTVVALVDDITRAAREGADDLAGRTYASVPSNLYAIVDALDRNPSDDLIDWWTDAQNEWAARARHVLDQSGNLSTSLHGGQCPYCGAVNVREKHDREICLMPAIHVEWDTQGPIAYQVHSVHCRACDARWVRGDELDALIDDVIRRNYELTE